MTFFLLFGFSGYSNLIGNAMRSQEGLSNLFESPAAQANNCALSLATSLNMSISFSKCQCQVSSTVLSQVRGPLAGCNQQDSFTLNWIEWRWQQLASDNQHETGWFEVGIIQFCWELSCSVNWKCRLAGLIVNLLFSTPLSRVASTRKVC